MALFYFLFNPDCNCPGGLDAPAYRKSPAFLHCHRFAAHKTVIDHGKAIEKDRIGRNKLAVTDEEAIAHLYFFKQNTFFVSVVGVQSCYCHRKVRGIIAVEGHRLVSAALKPAAYKHKEQKSRKAIAITLSALGEHLPGSDQKQGKNAHGNRKVDVDNATSDVFQAETR